MVLNREVSHFILRRAWRFGYVKRADVLSAFDGQIAESHASFLMNAAVEKHSEYLLRDGHRILPKAEAKVPKEASEQDLMESLFAGCYRFKDTGLRERELPIYRSEWFDFRPPRPGTFSEIVSAFVEHSDLHIDYVSMRSGAQASSRLVKPVGLEELAGQWRLRAYDIEDGKLKTFVLSRIVFARALKGRSRKSSGQGVKEEAKRYFPAKLDSRFTSAQCQVLEQELKISNGFVQLKPSHRFEYLRRFGHAPTSEDVIWPPLENGE